MTFAPNASFFGITYWVFGVVWFPLIFVVGLWSTRLGRDALRTWTLALLSVGNIFTVYLWYLDLVEIRAFTAVYVGLYVTNYALTGLVVAENWSKSEMKDFGRDGHRDGDRGLLRSLRGGGPWGARRSLRGRERLHVHAVALGLSRQP